MNELQMTWYLAWTVRRCKHLLLKQLASWLSAVSWSHLGIGRDGQSRSVMVAFGGVVVV